MGGTASEGLGNLLWVPLSCAEVTTGLSAYGHGNKRAFLSLSRGEMCGEERRGLVCHSAGAVMNRYT